MPAIYLDYAATTPVDQRVAAAMHAYLTQDDNFGNSASQHSYGLAARSAIEIARAQVASYINAEVDEIIWTSGATEANNLALKGAAYMYQQRGKHIITAQTEHKAVLDTCQYLEKQGFAVSYLAPHLQTGEISAKAVEAAIRADTILVALMHINNETGVINDIATIAQLTRARGILLHVDGAQTPGKLALDVNNIPLDLLALSAHKIYGPKGIGALYVRKRPRVRLVPLLHGGGHEQGLRSGTLPTHQIVGMGAAFALAKQEFIHDTNHIRSLRDYFVRELQALPEIQLNAALQLTVPHILSVRFRGVIAQALLAQLPQLLVSTAAACQDYSNRGSHVLRALGLNPDDIKSTVRFSFGRFTTQAEIAAALQLVKRQFAVDTA